ncbi:MAG: hypothetical protein HW421_753 [Ignavibacteria bacterium]|nr:hypothetical protein [Ignavibacteria bacterium]
MPDKNNELISVIIPTWNRANLIEKAIGSVLAQTYSNLEVLICDDGSTDNTEEIVSSINDKRIRFIAGTHAGVPAVPKNRGITESKGEWLAFLDSDDLWFPAKLEKQLRRAKELNCLASSTNAVRFVPGEGEKDTFIYWKKPRINFNNLLAGNLIISSSAMLHRSIFAKTEGFPEEKVLKVGEDYSLWLRVLTQTDCAYINERLVVYTDEPKSSVRAKQVNIWEVKKIVFNNFRNWAERQGIAPEFVRKTERWFLYSLPNLPSILINGYKKYSR